MVYRWNKSKIVYTETAATQNAFSGDLQSWQNGAFTNTKPVLNPETGRFNFSNANIYDTTSSSGSGYTYNMIVDKGTDSSGTATGTAAEYYTATRYGMAIIRYSGSSDRYWRIGDMSGGSGNQATRHSAVAAKGAFVGFVYAEKETAYPNGGASGGYWYDGREEVSSPTAPDSITVPTATATPEPKPWS